jgi:hypothetical protein
VDPMDHDPRGDAEAFAGGRCTKFMAN